MCVFCELSSSKKVIFEDEYCYVVYDINPASKGHCLVISKRHAETYFDLTKEEMQSMFLMSKKVKEMLDERYHPLGYNIGFNVKHAGGQKIMHAHMHIIPRYGDNPKVIYKGIRSLKPSEKIDK